MKYSLVLALLLIGCSKPINIKPEEPVKAPIPQNLLTDLLPLPHIENSTMGALLLHDVEIINRYNECAIKYKRLKEAVQ